MNSFEPNIIFSSNFEPSSTPSNHGRFRINITFKTSALTLFYVLPDTHKERYTQIKKTTDICARTQKEIRRKTIERGFNPNIDRFQILSEHLIDTPQSGRSASAFNPKHTRQIIEIVTKDKSGREKSREIIAFECESSVSRQLVYRMLKISGFKKVKKSTKSGLNNV